MPLFGLFGPPNVENLKAKGDVQGLIKALGYEKDESVRRKAAQALKGLGWWRVFEPLTGALKSKNKYVRQGAARVLGQIGDVQAVEPLVATLEDIYAYRRICLQN
jgi:HEAT repeat protein